MNRADFESILNSLVIPEEGTGGVYIISSRVPGAGEASS